MTITALRLKRAARIGLDAFGSASSTDLAGLMLWAILGLIASLLVQTPGDQTACGLASVYDWFAGR